MADDVLARARALIAQRATVRERRSRLADAGKYGQDMRRLVQADEMLADQLADLAPALLALAERVPAGAGR
jgi:hypothetical protein